jgi:manganese transport protein
MNFAPGSTLASWRRDRGDPSLAEVHGSITVAAHGSVWRKAAAFLGPGYLVAVGYMDPGNWATSLAGGAKFGYALLFIALLSNVMAIILQHLCARMAVATGRDLAQACAMPTHGRSLIRSGFWPRSRSAPQTSPR